jgi:hypothetical protein
MSETTVKAPKAKKQKTVISSALAADVKSTFRYLRDVAGINYIQSEWNKGNSMSIQLTDGFKGFISKLPPDQDMSLAVKMFRRVSEVLTDLYGNNKVGIMVHRGSLYQGGQLADCETINA